MLRRTTPQRALATCLLFSLFFGFNLCSIESIFAEASVVEAPDHECSHHADKKSQDKHDNEDQTCCSNFLAVSTYLKSDFSPNLELKSALSLDTFSEAPRDFSRLGGNYLIDFLSDKSPPVVFLLTHFNHAPPVSR